MEDGQHGAERSDAQLIAAAVNAGWIARGFKLGIGFWLAGVVIVIGTCLVALMLGLTAGGLANLEPAPFNNANATPPQSDNRGWREQLQAQERAAEEMRQRMDQLNAEAKRK